MARAPVRIATLAAVRARVPLRRPFTTATGTWTAIDSWVVRLRDADGRTGMGEVAHSPGAAVGALAASAQAVRHAAETINRGARPDSLLAEAPPAVRAALDAALVGCGSMTFPGTVPAPGTPVAVNATIGDGGGAEVAAAARVAVAAGFRTLKLKGGGEQSVAELVARVSAVRDAVGPGIALRLDVNGAWDVTIARAALTALEPLGLEYVEQPLAPRGGDELAALAEIRHGTAVPLALDESVEDVASARAILDAGVADALVVKPARVGGIRATIAIARMAATTGVPVIVSTMLETGIGLAAALATAAALPRAAGDRGLAFAHGLATGRLLVSDLLAEPLVLSAGAVATRDLTDLRLDEEALREHCVDVAGEPW